MPRGPGGCPDCSGESWSHESAPADAIAIDARCGAAARARERTESRYVGGMESAEKLLAQALLLPPDEREGLAARLLDSLEPLPGISIEDREELEARAAEARRGTPGVAWEDLKRTLFR